MIAYHATPLTRLAAILTGGLRLGMPRTWSDALGKKQGSTKHLYFCLGEDEAVRWAYKMQYDLGQPCVVLVVDLDDAEWTDDPHPEGRLSGYRWIQVAAAIPADQIDHVLPLTTARIRAVVARTAAVPAAA